MRLSNIFLKHWLLFNYDTSKSVTYIPPHHIFPIKDSIHYQALKSNNFSDYEKYISTTKQMEHSVSSFKKLNDFFDLEIMEPILLKNNKRLGRFLVEDGCHRLSIILYKNIFTEELPDRYIRYE